MAFPQFVEGIIALAAAGPCLSHCFNTIGFRPHRWAEIEGGSSMNWPKLLNSDRRRPTTSPGDHRLEFERDYDRAVFSTPVKRLQDKAQVFPLEPNDAIR